MRREWRSPASAVGASCVSTAAIWWTEPHVPLVDAAPSERVAASQRLVIGDPRWRSTGAGREEHGIVSQRENVRTPCRRTRTRRGDAAGIGSIGGGEWPRRVRRGAVRMRTTADGAVSERNRSDKPWWLGWGWRTAAVERSW